MDAALSSRLAASVCAGVAASVAVALASFSNSNACPREHAHSQNPQRPA